MWRNRGKSGAYPVTVSPPPQPGPPPRGGVENFDQDEAISINRARLAHLESLGLPIAGRTVLDIGCGVGHLAQYFVSQQCKVVCADAREANIASLRQRYPGLDALALDVETAPLSRLGRFDIVFCYGLLYHLENPIAALRNIESVCDDLLLLETVVSDHRYPVLRLDEETSAFSQALRGVASRPSPSFVVLVLSRIGFRHIYAPAIPPAHPDFIFTWKNDLAFSRDGHLLRCIFVASRRKLDNPRLVPILPET